MINIASKIVLVPLFLLAWGADIYGEWLLLSSMVAYLSLTEMGAQLYIVNRMTQAYAQRDHDQFCKILHTGLALFLIIPVAVFIIFVTVILFFNPSTVLHINQTSHGMVVLVLAILAFQIVVSLPQSILLRVYFAVEMLPRGVMLINFMQLMNLILLAGGLWAALGHGAHRPSPAHSLWAHRRRGPLGSQPEISAIQDLILAGGGFLFWPEFH